MNGDLPTPLPSPSALGPLSQKGGNTGGRLGEPSLPLSEKRGHERRDVPAKWVFAVVFLLFLFGLSLHGIIACFMKSLNKMPSPTDLWNPAKGAHVGSGFPVLQVSPRLDLKEFRRREEVELNSYGWINRTAGIVRVPIEQAMDIVLQEGLPVRSGTNGNRLGPSPDQLIQQNTGGNQ